MRNCFLKNIFLTLIKYSMLANFIFISFSINEILSEVIKCKFVNKYVEIIKLIGI